PARADLGDGGQALLRPGGLRGGAGRPRRPTAAGGRVGGLSPLHANRASTAIGLVGVRQTRACQPYQAAGHGCAQREGRLGGREDGASSAGRIHLPSHSSTARTGRWSEATFFPITLASTTRNRPPGRNKA